MLVPVGMVIAGLAVHFIGQVVDIGIAKFVERSLSKVTGEKGALSPDDLSEIQSVVRMEYKGTSPPVSLIPERCGSCGAPVSERHIRGLSIVCSFCDTETRLRFSSADEVRVWLQTHAERKGPEELADELEARVVARLGGGVLGKGLGELSSEERRRLDSAVGEALVGNGIPQEGASGAVSALAAGGSARRRGALDELGNLLVIGAKGASDAASGLAERMGQAYALLGKRHAENGGGLEVLVDKARDAEGKGVPKAVMGAHQGRIGSLRRFHGRLEGGLREIQKLKDRRDLSDAEREAAVRALALMLADAEAAAGQGIAAEERRLSRVISVTSTARWAKGVVEPEGATRWTKTSSSKRTEDMF